MADITPTAVAPVTAAEVPVTLQPTTDTPDTITISTIEYGVLQFGAKILAALKNFGVEAWEGFEGALASIKSDYEAAVVE